MANFIDENYRYTLTDVIDDTKSAFMGGISYAQQRSQLQDALPTAEIPGVGEIAISTISDTTKAALGGLVSVALAKVIKNIKMPPMA